ncbi:MAG: hypothetical protein ABEJ88_06495 [Halobacterium sp.]
MTASQSPLDVAELLPQAFAFAVGALVAGFATLTAWTNAYMGANPAVGSVSGSSDAVLAVLFVLGVVAMFLAAAHALAVVVREAN